VRGNFPLVRRRIRVSLHPLLRRRLRENEVTLPSTTMSSDLKSLQGHAPHQEKLIKSLSGPSFPNYHFRDTDDEDWVEFWKVAWDTGPDSLDGTEKVERSSDPIDDSLVGVVPTDHDVMLKPEVTIDLWYLKPECKKILIRSEYMGG